jgi:hypothetical protein
MRLSPLECASAAQWVYDKNQIFKCACESVGWPKMALDRELFLSLRCARALG